MMSSPRKPRVARLGDALHEPLPGQRVLAAQVQVAELAAGRVAGDRHRLDHAERIVLEDHAVLERPRLGLVGVADQVVRADRVGGRRPPTCGRSGTPRRRGRAASASVTSRMTPCRPEVERGRRRLVAAVGAVAVEALGSTGRPGAGAAALGRPACGTSGRPARERAAGQRAGDPRPRRADERSSRRPRRHV